ncbi:zinc finger protein 644-like [Solea senegalensis]|uniref:Zinc finger protein 644-like n=2 Tax=Solea senegalensis TaxID=28829 RepID=A0AAV6T911_SOLSE|nr:zinc finger protein 644-like [Solea senegalensis]
MGGYTGKISVLTYNSSEAMAAEMSCLTCVDEDDKGADSEINALSLLQVPLRMAQDSASSTDSFSKCSLKENNVLDVLSNTDVLSPVGLGNGPSSRQATQANELNSLSMEKEEEKSITPLKTVQEIDTASIWGFDADSPENTMDNVDSAGNLQWDPHKEFMQFLWENGDSPCVEPNEESPPTNSQRRRKRKMDMVVMVDPSEDLYPDLSHKSSEELSDAGDPVDSSPGKKVENSRNFPNSQSLPTENISKYPNGTVKAIKEILYSAPTKNSHLNIVNQELSPLKGSFTINSHSGEKSSCYPCSKCKLVFKKEYHLHSHMKSHGDPKPFICCECGQSFRQSASLLEHMSIHQNKRTRVGDEIKDKKAKAKEYKNRKLFCPQCSFATACSNAFVQHAKTHDKNKRKLKCLKCSFMSMSESDLRRHYIMQHTVITDRTQVQNGDSGTFSCNICSYRAFSKTVFRNHLLRRHQQTVEEYDATQLSEKRATIQNNHSETISCYICSYRAFSKNVMKNHVLRRHQQSYEEYEAAQATQKKAQPSKEQHVPTCKSPVENAQFTSKISFKNQIPSKIACSTSESSDLSDLFKNSKIKRGFKSQLTESKLDKSINVLLSRQQHGRKNSEQKKQSNNCKTSAHDSKSDEDGSCQFPESLTVKVEDFSVSPNGHSMPSGAAETYLNHISEPKVNVNQSSVKKSPSKRKMSTPYHNTSDQDSSIILSNPFPSPKKINQGQVEDFDILHFKDTDPNANSYDNGLEKQKQNVIYTYSRRMSMRGAMQASKRLFEKIKTEEQELSDPEIKDECIETEISQETFDSHQIPLEDSFDDLSDLEADHKNCPYCPAVFESGVGLSNHVRGHLHRVGLSYNARHVVSPEQVAYQDRRPRIRRKISALRRLKKALQMESDSETMTNIHSCPLCGDSFDNRTGQSNHIRGHLKKLGKNISTKKKSPLVLLRELMRDKKEFQRALQIVGKRRNHFQYGGSPKLSNADRFTPPPIGIPKNNSITSICTDAKTLSTFSLEDMKSERMQEETKLDVSSTALIGILKRRKCQEDARLKGSQISRNMLTVSSNSEHTLESGVAASFISEKGEFNRKVCVHCNASFHSGVSLSNHLRAYAKRKRNALLEGTTFDCKARRQRSRPGSKKKTLPLLQTPEEMYRLTCRFCDLVFQGPLSVQEDWIKHLQRHIMNTSVPHTGLGMVEVTSLPMDPQALKTDQDSSLTPTHAAS